MCVEDVRRDVRDVQGVLQNDSSDLKGYIFWGIFVFRQSVRDKFYN